MVQEYHLMHISLMVLYGSQCIMPRPAPVREFRQARVYPRA